MVCWHQRLIHEYMELFKQYFMIMDNYNGVSFESLPFSFLLVEWKMRPRLKTSLIFYSEEFT
jgi:hypothetical protein